MKAKDIEAGGGVVYKASENGELMVLLIYRNGVWDIPKGKREKKETREMCATREVMEEVNSDSLPLIIDELVTTHHSYEQKNKRYNKITFWYSMEFESEQKDLQPETKEGIEKVEWVVVNDAIEKVGYKNLVEVLEDVRSKVKV